MASVAVWGSVMAYVVCSNLFLWERSEPSGYFQRSTFAAHSNMRAVEVTTP